MPSSQAVTLINIFEVQPDADDAFIAGWKRTRELLAGRGGFAGLALHRAWRRDADFRFVAVARVEAVADPAFPAGSMPFEAHPGLYEVVHEEGAPDGVEGVVLINPFEVAASEDESFLTGWERARAALAQRPGYLGTRLHRSVAARADFRFVNIARWSSPLAFSRAVQRPEFQAAAEAMAFVSHPALYQVIGD